MCPQNKQTGELPKNCSFWLTDSAGYDRIYVKSDVISNVNVILILKELPVINCLLFAFLRFVTTVVMGGTMGTGTFKPEKNLVFFSG